MRRPAYRVLHNAPPGIQGVTYACNICYCITPLAWVEIQSFALTAYCLHAYMLTCLHAYMLTCLHACMFTYSFAYMLTCLNVGMITCLHAYMLPKVETNLAKGADENCPGANELSQH